MADALEYSLVFGWSTSNLIPELSDLRRRWVDTYNQEYSRISGQVYHDLDTASVEKLVVPSPSLLTPPAPPSTDPYEPRPYQHEGISFFLSHPRSLNYDQAGMGKTLQASMAATFPCLISTRGYATEQWEEFLHRQFPGRLVMDLPNTFPTHKLNSHFKRQNYLNNLPTTDFTIINIEMWNAYTFPHDYATYILDESNLLKSRGAGRSIKAKKVVTRDMGSRVYELTATPITREADDLWMQLSILDPKRFGSYWTFVEHFMLIRRTPWGNQIVGVKPERKAELRALFNEYAIGRTYAQVGLQLPHIIPPDGPKPLYASMPKDLKKAYDNVKKNYTLEWAGREIPLSAAGEMVSVLRRMTAHPTKWQVAYDKLDSLNWLPTIVFAHHKETCHAFAKFIHEKDPDVNATVITGDIKAPIRLLTAKKSNLVVATIDSLNDAVDLSHMRVVMFIEEDYTYGKMDSAIKRVWRFRPDLSTDPVLLFIVMMRGTIDVSTHKTAGRRFGTVRDVLNVELWEK